MKRMWSKNELAKQVKEVKKDIATLVDADGHNRFDHGDITINEISGVTQTFGKWALSGSHLLIVLACDFADTTVLSASILAQFELPQWIFDKISVLYGGSIVLNNGSSPIYADDFSQQTIGISLQKGTGKLFIYNGALTLTKDRHGRFAFDLLID